MYSGRGQQGRIQECAGVWEKQKSLMKCGVEVRGREVGDAGGVP
jgi:hypothetical protein